jgi:hypothetical protein
LNIVADTKLPVRVSEYSGSDVRRAGFAEAAELSRAAANSVPPRPRVEAEAVPKIFQDLKGASSSY